MKLIVAITKGILHDQHVRRTAMFVIVVITLLWLFTGFTFLSGWLRERPTAFIVYWAACAWLTLTTALLAIYDILALRVIARRERRELRRRIFGEEKEQ